jgi:hypothetical protein
VTYHGVPPDSIVITGAPRFDDFFAMRPSTTREEFCARAGIDPTRPFVLYLCSSHFVAPEEVPFVRRWAQAVRGASDAALARCGVLVRPHPANAEQWEQADLGGIDNAAVWSEPAKVQADPALYDSLYHAEAVVGLNTSAMIEAGIVGKAVYTIQTAEFAGGQEQTLHFHYLLAQNGGLVEVAADLPQHLRQLSEGLAKPEVGRARSRKFIESFVRPRGIDRPVAPILAEEIEKVATLRKRPRHSAPWHYPARALLLALLKRRAPAS